MKHVTCFFLNISFCFQWMSHQYVKWLSFIIFVFTLIESRIECIIWKNPSTVQFQVFKLICDGKSSLHIYVTDGMHAICSLRCKWIHRTTNISVYWWIATLYGHDTVVREILSHSPDRTKTIELEGQMHSVNDDLV